MRLPVWSMSGGSSFLVDGRHLVPSSHGGQEQESKLSGVLSYKDTSPSWGRGESHSYDLT